MTPQRPLTVRLGYIAFGVLAALTSAFAAAAEYTVNPGDDLFAVCANLQAGDHVVVNGGSYNTPGYRLLTFAGTASQPVVVEAAAGTTPLIIGDIAAQQNTLNIDGQYFTFRGFEIIQGSHGIRLENVHHAVFEDLHIHNTVDVTLSANYAGKEYYDIVLRRLHIHHTGGTGEGMYLGCNEGACVFHDNLIEYNWIHDTNHAVAQGDGIEIKQGSYGNIVRNNVIHDTQYPCIIVYGTAGHARNLVENNVLWNCQDSGIQAAADAILRNNIIFTSGNGINSHSHQTAVPSHLDIVNNSVFDASDRCLRASDWAGSTGIVVANNAFYCEGGNAIRIASGGTDIVFTNNLILGAVEGISTGFSTGRSTDADFVDVTNHNAWPTDDAPVIGAAAPSYASVLDFNWHSRDSAPDIGAYEWQAAGNPGWSVSPMIRPAVDVPQQDAGLTADGNAPADTGVADRLGDDSLRADATAQEHSAGTDVSSNVDAGAGDSQSATGDVSADAGDNGTQRIGVGCQCAGAGVRSSFGIAVILLVASLWRRRW